MAKQIYTLWENENEVFSVDASLIEIENNAKESVLTGIQESIQDFLSGIPIIHYFFEKKGACKIIVTDRRVILAMETSSCCCGGEISVISLSHTMLNGFNSYVQTSGCCGCNKSQFRFSIGLTGSDARDFTFDTDTISSPEEAAAVLAKFDEVVKSYSK